MLNKQPIHWQAVEMEYRAGIKSLRQIADEQGITEGAIRKRAKRDAWSRDLAERVRQKADELVRKDAVRREDGGAEPRTTEREVVEANAEMQARVRREHRGDIMRLRRLMNTLADELELAIGSRQAFEDAILALISGDDVKGAHALQKAMALPTCITSLESLSRTLANLIKLEREAFGIDSKAKEESPLEKLLREVAAAEGDA